MNTRLRILHITPYYPPHIGGLQSHADQFNEHISQHADVVTLTARFPRHAPASQQQLRNASVTRFPAWEAIPNYPLPKFWQTSFWHIWRDLKNQEFDLVISRTRFFFTSLMALRYAKQTKTPWLHIEHGSDFVSSANPLVRLAARTYDYTLGRMVLLKAGRVVANSRASARFVAKLSNRKATIIYRGIDKDAIADIKPANLSEIHNLPPTTIKIIFVGRLIDGKGVDDLLRAMELLAVDCTLLLVGSGPQEKHLKALAQRLAIAERVLFLGERSFQQTMAILKSSDIFVNPSHTEGLPTSVIEAALCKVTIIATNVGGTPEIISDPASGYLLPARKPHILAQKLAELLSNRDQRTSLANHAYQEVLTKFTWDQAIREYQSIFKKLI